MDDLYDFPAGHVGRKRYVSVRGHAKSIPVFKTYRGVDGYNYLLPEYGGSYDGLGNSSPLVLRDKGAYHSPLDGTTVEGRTAHREHMKRHGVIEAGDMPMPVAREYVPDRAAIREEIRRSISQHS